MGIKTHFVFGKEDCIRCFYGIVDADENDEEIDYYCCDLRC